VRSRLTGNRQGVGAQIGVAHDCERIINPDGLERCMEGNVVQSTSRTLSEKVSFDRANVTGVYWTTYPILDNTEVPEAVDMVLINRPELPPAGAGASSIRPFRGGIGMGVPVACSPEGSLRRQFSKSAGSGRCAGWRDR